MRGSRRRKTTFSGEVLGLVVLCGVGVFDVEGEDVDGSRGEVLDLVVPSGAGVLS